MKTAIILGATGLTGGLLLDKLIADENYKTIKVFTRKSTGKASLKVKEFIGDLLLLENFKEDFFADEVYCCIGTTAKKTKDKTRYKNIDYGIPVAAAKLSKENDIPFFVVISAMGANEKSSVFYNKTKGEMEQAVLAQNIKNTYILRPSLIKGNRTETRFAEDLGNCIARIINPFLIGKLAKYKNIKAETIAAAMKNISALKLTETILFSDTIKALSKV
ncbi:NAD-dependent epimerase/dehydratase family protein [Tenacibaculum piscium]|uniref:NAD-dependent epimerase/dehydratase family protein n=1 Tax=Tenacibaculum piscium TaxID=1458515 RepID=UPI00187B50B8|nr:NAD(P)H-binding protein [Tenacibaculum piscium]MBE7685721.1 nucleoside-diphosphate sugar epimerase [Tenacibaculum piscium]MBE7690288.1 nucleoside-diphosphate sugar epimerase [Tenacibaculum piscium]